MAANWLTSLMGSIIVFQLGLILNYLKKTIAKVESTEEKVQDHEIRITVIENNNKNKN